MSEIIIHELRPAIVYYLDLAEHDYKTTSEIAHMEGQSLSNLAACGFVYEDVIDVGLKEPMEVLKVIFIHDMDEEANSKCLVIPLACVKKCIFLPFDEDTSAELPKPTGVN